MGVTPEEVKAAVGSRMHYKLNGSHQAPCFGLVIDAPMTDLGPGITLGGKPRIEGRPAGPEQTFTVDSLEYLSATPMRGAAPVAAAPVAAAVVPVSEPVDPDPSPSDPAAIAAAAALAAASKRAARL